MRLAVLMLAVAVGIGPAHGQRKKDDRGAVERACGVNDCFFERDVRGFEVIGENHLIVYVGPQRCAFHVELRGTFCDMTFAPELDFRKPNEALYDTASPSGAVQTPGGRAAVLDPFNVHGEDPGLKICRNDLSVQVHGGPFTETDPATQPPDRFGNPRANCQVSTVSAITDDQLIEFYVARGVAAPPPPMGTGEIEVGEQEEQGSEEPSSSGRGEDRRR